MSIDFATTATAIATAATAITAACIPARTASPYLFQRVRFIAHQGAAMTTILDLLSAFTTAAYALAVLLDTLHKLRLRWPRWLRLPSRRDRRRRRAIRHLPRPLLLPSA